MQRPGRKTVKKSAAKKHPAKKKVASSVSRKRATVKKKNSTIKTASKQPKSPSFPIVGIGASAGGLEAITALLKHLPADLGMAFVLVQHLAPGHESMLTELLKRETTLEVLEVTDGLKVKSNHLYVIPPNTNLGIINNSLHLMPRDPNKQHLPIDYFFQSLAADQGSNAIGIILSGSASDGTLGLKAIKAGDGIAFAQTPETARYESMPESAIAAGCVDFVLSPEEIARELTHLARHPSMLRADIATSKDEPTHINTELEKVFMILRNRTGNDFTYYKHTTIRRRITRRMLVNKIDRLKDYVRYLNSHPAEVEALFQDILINVTGFFRDPDAFEVLKNTVFPAILQNHDSGRPLRIWVPGCSTGEEVYSIIISLLEFLGNNAAGTTVQVFASDIDQKAIEKARTGIYPEGISAEVSPERLRRFFSKVPQGYQINKRIRDLCIFATQNLAKDPPFSHLDLITCRNMLIYMGNILQRKILQTLHYALNPNGFLFLGSSETIGASADLFTMAGKEHKIYKKKDVPRNTQFYTAKTTGITQADALTLARPLANERQPLDLQKLAESIILNQYSPPGVVVNEQLDVVQFIGLTGKYMEPAPGMASLNLIKLAHPDLTIELRMAVHNAIRNKGPSHRDGVPLRHKGKIEQVTIEVVPLPMRSDPEHYYLVMFRKTGEIEVSKPPTTKKKTGKKAGALSKEEIHAKDLEQELEATRTYMQAIIEDQESANEELQAANEEIQSTNEELQSTNEELETAKEELQSTNEELVTVNEELENRNAELSTSNDDLKNIIASTDLPVVMLNETLRIRFFSPQAHQLLNLIDSDIGRPIGDIRPNLETGDITEQVHKVIETLRPLTCEVHNHQGHWYSMRIQPYRTEDNRIQGVVIVFIDITDSKTLQRASRLATVVEDSNDAIMVLNFDGRIMEWNPKASRIYGYSEEEAINTNIEMIVPKQKHEELKKAISKLLQNKVVMPFETERQDKGGKKLRMLVTLSVLNDEQGRPMAIAATEHQLID